MMLVTLMLLSGALALICTVWLAENIHRWRIARRATMLFLVVSCGLESASIFISMNFDEPAWISYPGTTWQHWLVVCAMFAYICEGAIEAHRAAKLQSERGAAGASP